MNATYAHLTRKAEKLSKEKGLLEYILRLDQDQADRLEIPPSARRDQIYTRG